MQIADPIPTPATSPAAHSRFWQRLHRRYGDVLALLPPGPPTRQTLEQALQALSESGGGIWHCVIVGAMPCSGAPGGQSWRASRMPTSL